MKEMNKARLPITFSIKSTILNEAIEYVQTIFSEKEKSPVFHGLHYINEAAEVAVELADEYEQSNTEKEILLIAIWFYFSGFKTNPKAFGPESIRICNAFLLDNNYSKNGISQVLELLEKPFSSANSLNSQILHDALISFKGKNLFFSRMELLRIERENLFNKVYTDHDWSKIVYTQLTNCTFFTDAARIKFQKRKIKNTSKQRTEINKARKTTTRKKTGKEFGRGVDTLYRTNYNNHIKLSAIADGKANMMISINTIILSVIVTMTGARFTLNKTFSIEHFRFTIPIAALLIGALISAIFAILSARPKVTEQKIDIEHADKDRSSLLFFGNFLQVSLEEFVSHLSELKLHEQSLYDSMSIDIYYLGSILKKKFSLLTWSYNCFMIGIVLSVVSFLFIFFYTTL
jgi:hypothetical protein